VKSNEIKTEPKKKASLPKENKTFRKRESCFCKKKEKGKGSVLKGGGEKGGQRKGNRKGKRRDAGPEKK